MVLTHLHQCTTAKVQYPQDSPTGTFLHLSSTSIISLPHLTWTALQSACWITVALAPSGLLPHLQKIGMGPRVGTSPLSLQPNASKAVWMQRPHPTCGTLMQRGKSMTLAVHRSLLVALQAVPWRPWRTAGRRSLLCQVSCLIERLPPAPRTVLSAVSSLSHLFYIGLRETTLKFERCQVVTEYFCAQSCAVVFVVTRSWSSYTLQEKEYIEYSTQMTHCNESPFKYKHKSDQLRYAINLF